MDNLIRHIRQSLSWKLSLGILLMAIPIFVLSIGFLFIHSRDKVKKKATEHAASVVNTTMQHITRYMDIVETATDVNDWEVTANLDPDTILAISRGIVVLNGHIDGCSRTSSRNTAETSPPIPSVRQTPSPPSSRNPTSISRRYGIRPHICRASLAGWSITTRATPWPLPSTA